MLYLCMHACMQHGQRTEKELKSQLAITYLVSNTKILRWVLWVVGGKASLFEGCLAVVQYSTVLYKKKKLRSSTTTDSIVNPSTLNIPHSTFTQKEETEPRNFTLDFFDKRSRLISNSEKVYLFVYKSSIALIPFSNKSGVYTWSISSIGNSLFSSPLPFVVRGKDCAAAAAAKKKFN